MFELKQINDPFSQEFKELYALYEEAFPPIERRKLEILQKMIPEDNGMTFCAIMLDGKAIGLFILWDMIDFIYVEHFAIFSKIRGTSLGTQFLADFLEKNKTRTIVGEIEHPTTDIARRRKEFYERYDFRVIDENYMQPTYSEDDDGFPLLLVANKKMSEEEIISCKQNLIKKVYQCEK